MLRELASLPTAPQRLLDDIHEIKLLLREVLSVHHELTEISRSMDRKLSVANEKLDHSLGELGRLNEGVERLDGRLVTVQEELLQVRNGVREIAELVPDLNRGPIDKMKDAIAGE